MKRTTIRLLITLLTFLTGTMGAFLYVKFNNSNNQKSVNSSNRKILNDDDENTKFPTLNLCELSSEPQKYDGKIIRLNATLEFSQEGKWFYDSSCKSSKGGIKPYVKNQEAREIIERAREQKSSDSRDDLLDITVVGKFKIEDSKDSFIIVPYQFEILEVEEVSKSNREIIWEY